MKPDGLICQFAKLLQWSDVIEAPEWFGEEQQTRGWVAGNWIVFLSVHMVTLFKKLTAIGIDSFLIKSNHIHLGEPLGE